MKLWLHIGNMAVCKNLAEEGFRYGFRNDAFHNWNYLYTSYSCCDSLWLHFILVKH